MACGINGATDYFTFSPPVTGTPFTLSVWVYAPTLNSRFVINMANGESYHSLLYLSDGTAIARSFVSGDGSFNGQSTTSGFTAAAWHHLCGVWTSNANRQIYLNGSSGTANTTTKNVGTLTSASAAASTGVHYIADIGIWNVALTAAEIASLAKGFSASRVRAASLLHYMPLVRARQEVKTGAALTDVGTPTVQTHPPIIGAIAA
jgi:hypothetical protein